MREDEDVRLYSRNSTSPVKSASTGNHYCLITIIDRGFCTGFSITSSICKSTLLQSLLRYFPSHAIKKKLLTSHLLVRLATVHSRNMEASSGRHQRKRTNCLYTFKCSRFRNGSGRGLSSPNGPSRVSRLKKNSSPWQQK